MYVYAAGSDIMKRQHGFTLLELLTVLAIVAVCAGIGGIGLLRGMPERRMMSAARDLYRDLRKAQSRAIARGEEITVDFGPESGTISLIDAGGHVFARKKLPGYIDLFEIRGDGEAENRFFFNSRGIKTGVSGSVWIRYYKPGCDWRQVVVRSTGAMRIRRSGDNGKTWE